MQIKEMRLSLIQFEPQMGFLRSPSPREIPFSFLLDGGKFQLQFERALKQDGSCRAPWYTGYGKRFWSRYVGDPSYTVKDVWKAQVPLQYNLEPAWTAAWLKGHARARAYLYPWGIGVLVDIGVADTVDIAAAVDQAAAIRRNQQMEMTLNGAAQQNRASDLLGQFRKYVRDIAYGPETPEVAASGTFMIVTVLDADGANATQAVADQSDLHRQLNGFARGIPDWRTAPLDKLPANTLPTNPASAGSILYATDRGRAVWLPESFKSAGQQLKNSLRCYHQNLTVATLQTESLCVLAHDAAAWIGEGSGHNTWPVNYDWCAQRVAGLLGRLTGKSKIYGSWSIARQIGDAGPDVKTLRTEYQM